MQKKIRIIATPPGQAPDEIREKWVGLELPINDNINLLGVQAGVFGGSATNLGGYAVNGNKAVELLSAKHPKAAKWWRENAPWVLSMDLVFKKEVCELI